MPGIPFILLENTRDTNGVTRLFEGPEKLIVCHKAEAVPGALAEIEKARREGFFAAGFFSYELGYALEPRLAQLMPDGRDVPLLVFGVFREGRIISRDERALLAEKYASLPWAAGHMQPAMSRQDYASAFDRVKNYIHAGDAYQVNLTFPFEFSFSGDPLSFYAALVAAQPVAHAAFMAMPDFHLLSLSPEMFFRIRQGKIYGRPMKGTAPRSANEEEDVRLKQALAADAKSRAENLMIVDLLRNDIGRIAETGSVRVTDLFTIESYETLHQMTSGIEAVLKPDLSVAAILAALFPCGSVTGAPKIRAMEIIRELETAPRGVYTGAIGYFGPNGDAEFNVAIRTAVISGSEGRMGIGSGLVADSQCADEYDECLLKAKFLTRAAPPFQLFETMRLGKDGYYLLERHLARLKNSAAYFGFQYDEVIVHEELKQVQCKWQALTPLPLREGQGVGSVRPGQAFVLYAPTPPLTPPSRGGEWRVRLTLFHDGRISMMAEAYTPTPPDILWHYRVSSKTIDPENIFFHHKTTHRVLYESDLKLARAEGCDEVVFFNRRGELCEGSFTNIFVEKDGRLFTPPLSCGLLPGTLRQELLETGKASEKILLREDLDGADQVFLGNALRGLIRAKLR